MAKVMMSSGHGHDAVFMSDLDVKSAEEIIDLYEGFYKDENEFVWELWIDD